jgi:Zn-dependent M16 (insulinase) family peptidase
MTFDLSHLTPEELMYLKFYSDMMGSGMATTNRTESQVLNDVVQKANTVSTSITALMDDKNDTSARPIFAVNYYGFEDEYADTFDLVSDMLLHSKVSDISTYGTRTIANIKAQYQSMFADPITLALIRSLAYTSPSYQYTNYFIGLDYYNFVTSLEQQIASNPSIVADKISAVRAKAFNKNNLTVLFAGDSSAQELYKASMPQFTQKLPNETYKEAVYALPKPAKREAITINSTVQYVSVNGSLAANNVAKSGKANVITYILNNLMLTPEIRLKGGAYGVGASVEGNNYYVYTYRDANYVNSLATIGSTDEFLKAVSPYLTEDTLESYKLSAYATTTQSSGEINDALATLISSCQGITRQDKINSLNELKSTSLADLPAYADYLEKINNNMNYVVVAPASAIEPNKNLFDSIIPLP